MNINIRITRPVQGLSEAIWINEVFNSIKLTVHLHPKCLCTINYL